MSKTPQSSTSPASTVSPSPTSPAGKPSLWERTNGYTVTPGQFTRLAYIALGALTLIILTGEAVRLTGSGLGCPHWPKCYGNVYPPLKSHALIEFSNRLVTVPVSIAAGIAWVGALRRRPYRRDLVWIGFLLPLGVVAQAILGGLTVRGELDYGWVMAHFCLSMLMLVAAAVLVWRARHEPSQRPLGADPTLVRSARGLVLLGALTIFAGSAATAAGPHAGGAPGQKINRLDFYGRETINFVIHTHGEIGFVFGLLSLVVWWLARKRSTNPTLHRSTTILCVLMAVQGVVGLDQYYNHLPGGLVWVHSALACAIWIAALWTALAAGRLRAVQTPAVERQAVSAARVTT